MNASCIIRLAVSWVASLSKIIFIPAFCVCLHIFWTSIYDAINWNFYILCCPGFGWHYIYVFCRHLNFCGHYNDTSTELRLWHLNANECEPREARIGSVKAIPWHFLVSSLSAGVDRATCNLALHQTFGWKRSSTTLAPIQPLCCCDPRWIPIQHLFLKNGWKTFYSAILHKEYWWKKTHIFETVRWNMRRLTSHIPLRSHPIEGDLASSNLCESNAPQNPRESTNSYISCVPMFLRDASKLGVSTNAFSFAARLLHTMGKRLEQAVQLRTGQLTVLNSFF